MPKTPINTSNNSGELRGADGRFLPGTKPPRSGGRPPGPNGIKARAALLASTRLEEMLGCAADVIDHELTMGNPQVAMWLVDRVRPARRSDYIRMPNPSSLATADDVIESAEAAVEAVTLGQLSVSDGRAYLNLLDRLTAFRSARNLEELQQAVQELKAEENRPIPNAHFPIWGRLKERMDETDKLRKLSDEESVVTNWSVFASD